MGARCRARRTKSLWPWREAPVQARGRALLRAGAKGSGNRWLRPLGNQRKNRSGHPIDSEKLLYPQSVRKRHSSQCSQIKLISPKLTSPTVSPSQLTAVLPFQVLRPKTLAWSSAALSLMLHSLNVGQSWGLDSNEYKVAGTMLWDF